MRCSHFGVQLILSVVLLISACSCALGALKTYDYTFDYPMSWSDNAVMKGLRAIQNWDCVDGGRPGRALRISAAVWQQPVSYEIRTLQFNHQPGTTANISFDIKANCAPAGSRLMIRYFDGYCMGEAFGKIADDEIAQFPLPSWDSQRERLPEGEWRHVSLETGKLNNTVLTLAIIVQQEEEYDANGKPLYMEYVFDNLRVTTTLLETYMDPGFDWHGVPGSSTRHFRQNVACASADWCGFADQEDVVTPEGVIHYTLLQFRDSSSQVKPEWKHRLLHADYCDHAGGVSAVVMERWGGGKNSSASWGVRQSVSYTALGLAPGESARIQVIAKVANFNPDDSDATSVQLGVDPYGDVITQKAKWLPPDRSDYKKDGWQRLVLEFDRPKDSDSFTIYFRHLDGLPKPEVEHLPFPEPQTYGSPGMAAAIADWIVLKVVK